MNATLPTPPRTKARRIIRDESLATSIASDLINCGYWFACQLLGAAGDQYEFAVGRENREHLDQIIRSARHRAGK